MNAAAGSPREEFAIVPPGNRFVAALVALAAAAPVLVVLLAISGMLEEIHIEALPRVLGLVFLVELPIFLLLFWLGRRRSVALIDGSLVVQAAFYKLCLSRREVDLDAAEIVDLREKREYRPRLRTNGYGVPGLAAGHFRDRQGRKLFCLVTAPRVVRLPVTDGSAVLLSAEHPDRLLRRLREFPWSE